MSIGTPRDVYIGPVVQYTQRLVQFERHNNNSSTTLHRQNVLLPLPYNRSFFSSNLTPQLYSSSHPTYKHSFFSPNLTTTASSSQPTLQPLLLLLHQPYNHSFFFSTNLTTTVSSPPTLLPQLLLPNLTNTASSHPTLQPQLLLQQPYNHSVFSPILTTSSSHPNLQPQRSCLISKVVVKEAVVVMVGEKKKMWL